ncbi:mannonate dehydratase [Candidatus Bathyarchaeota archaeon]|nr:mannonate dehydratase [Candidatus Bathyarchaeota archaeon]RJS81011.1 MAG: mannonate dehydratase [Candidatus Bathyarchaeota archaeon]RLG98154.1 MAG: mannonate dehydratase [Candidatus Bathyarchaeota archaeon]RLI20837.1 MAG: mannonate dehydratase [Candidatus Bathyarchaeota archaeon]
MLIRSLKRSALGRFVYMRLALGAIHEVTDEKLKFAKQLGVEDIIVHTPELRGEGYWEFLDLLHLRMRVESAGLRLAAIENVPREFYIKAMLGLPGRDKQIENFCKTLRNMGKAGIPILGYNWMPIGVWRTSLWTRGRGGAYVTSFDYDLVKDAPLTEYGVITDEQMWDNFTYFLERVVPVAEEAGVKLALHPDDPPVPSICGIARIFRSVEAFKKMIEIVPSDYNGLEFCQGCFSEMGADVIEAIKYFGSRKKIFYVHFRDVKGTVPKFEECFIDEGNVDMLEAMKAYKEVGFDGPMIVDHTPHIVDDTRWGHRGRAYAIGYMRALIEAVNKLC